MKLRQFLLSSLISLVLGFLVGVIFGLALGILIFRDKTGETTEITSTVVFDRIEEQAFLVTRTVVTDQKSTIVIDQGSAWSNLWWGHEVTAEGTIQVDIGVDFAELKKSDIKIDNASKTITIDFPDATVYDSSIKGPIEVTKKSGWFKKLFDNDPNEDYNLAMEDLTTKAEEGVTEDEELLAEARSSALSTLQAIFADTGYEVVEK